MTKPVIGVFDLASNLSEGIRNTTTVFDNPARDRVRMVCDEDTTFHAVADTHAILVIASSHTRRCRTCGKGTSFWRRIYSSHEHCSQPYSQREAQGQYWMKDLENGAYRLESYVAHISESLSLAVDEFISNDHPRRSSWWRQHSSTHDHTHHVLLVEQAASRLAAFIYPGTRSHYRGYRHPLRSQRREGV